MHRTAGLFGILTFATLASSIAVAQTRSAHAEVEVQDGEQTFRVSLDAETEHPDDELVLRLRVPRQRGDSFGDRALSSGLGALLGGGIGALLGLAATAWNPDAIGYGILAGAIFGGPIGASVGAALGTHSDAGTLLGTVMALPVGWIFGGFAGVGTVANGGPIEAGLGLAYVVSALLSVLVSTAWTGLEESSLSRPGGQKTAIRFGPSGLGAAF